jgi:hypothetical protein
MSNLSRDFNHARYVPGTPGGFYESYFQRANHPTRPLAFWIRYTIFCPKGRPQDAIGELWAVYFDGESGRHTVAKSELPGGGFEFSRERLAARIGDAMLEPGRLRGAAESRGHRIAWDLGFAGSAAPAFLLAPALYDAGLPKAKSLVGLPMASYDGVLDVDGTRVDVAGWIGSQNHNWGTKHTDRYAWGQVAGFDNAPDSFLEVGTGQIRIGGLWSPRLTPLVLRHGGAEYALGSLWQAVRARGRFGYFHWEFATRGPGVEIEGRMSAPKDAFVGLRYYNPPGGPNNGVKWCLNSKIASCRIELRRAGRPAETLETAHRAAFEILTDDLDHGIEIRT